MEYNFELSTIIAQENEIITIKHDYNMFN